MEPHVRYQIIDTIAQGDFAVVYRARDNELGREVAIKQIHQQYLADPQKLERYWQEAQLLASLEHPYIMTIYDIVRERGWLILELMQGSLQQKLDGNPIDLEDLRLTMTYVLHALHFLNQNGIVHGDVKPGNLLLDKNHRVKLGDFGIARRLSGDDGSVVKGTTKYMAPEVVSDQFGPVGPHSDLYSLGFSAYELMCGSHFDTLFPGLNMFGRDQQIAWMMWHSALDRRLPEISRVLQGVPEDLARVIEKLIEKDPSRRYQSAEKVVLELRAGGEGGDETMTADELAEAAQAEKKAKMRRYLLYAAVAMSMFLSLGILFSEQIFPKKTEPKQVEVTLPSAGTITNIHLDRNLIDLDPGGGQAKVGLSINAELDGIMLNGTEVSLADLQKGDLIAIRRYKTDDGKQVQQIKATRREAAGVNTKIVSINYGTAIITLDTNDENGQPLEVYIPSTIEITLNGSATASKRTVRLADLKVDDRVVVEHVPGESGQVAKSLAALRAVAATGYLVSINTDQRTIVLRGLAQDSARRTLPVAGNCAVSLNDAKVLAGGKAVTIADLKAEDRIQIQHDAQVTQIDAFREFSAVGVVSDVDYQKRRIAMRLDGKVTPVDFAVPAKCEIVLSDAGTPVSLQFVRAGDRLTIAHNSATLQNAEARAIGVTPEPDRGRWAIVIGQQQYDDNRLTALSHTQADAQSVHDVLLSQYRVPKDQMIFEQDATRLRLEQAIPAFLHRVTNADQLILYFVGHAYIDPTGKAVLAAKGFDMKGMEETGLPLKWLVTQLEECAALEKLLLLDTCHAGVGADLKSQPSAAELAGTLKNGPTRPVSTSVTVVASCSEGQRGLLLKDKSHGLFAKQITTALSGQADANHDHRVNSDELFGFLTTSMSEFDAGADRRQTPLRYLPDANPARLTQATQDAVLALLAHLRDSRFDNSVTLKYEGARNLQPKEPDVQMAYALVLLKHNRTSDSLKEFEAIRRQHPGELPPRHALAWQYFMRKAYQKGIDELEQLVLELPEPNADNGYDPYSASILELAGKMRGFALKAAEPALQLENVSKLDAAVQKRGVLSAQLFGAGVRKMYESVDELDGKIVAETNPNKRESLQLDRKRLTFYATFDFSKVTDHLRAGLVN